LIDKIRIKVRIGRVGKIKNKTNETKLLILEKIVHFLKAQVKDTATNFNTRQ